MRKMRILLSLMGLEIGGAETHAVELAKYLSKNGYLVYVVSSGGVYENELTKLNIPHYYAPLTSKSPINMLKSYKIIKQIVKSEKIDLIHAHARIPAFISSLVKKRLGIPLISTVHGVYSTKFWFKLLTNWGDEAICVSEDIKKYVIDNYKFTDKNTSVTINGIDTEKFSENTDYNDILKEFNINKDDVKIVYVSRLDQGNTMVAYSLVKIAEKLCTEIKNLKIIIVGGGDEFDKISVLCNEENNRLLKDVFVLTNSRTDVSKFCSMADIFIGISRAALEAMSSKKPVILGGNFGYTGLFDETKITDCLKNNFTCRGCKALDSDTLYTDILKAYNLTKEEKISIGELGKKVVKENFSISTMAEDTIKIYEKVNTNRNYNYDFMISGYYGFNNSGDDALLQAMINNIKSIDENVKIVVLSKNPEETIKRYKVDAVNRFNFLKIRSYMNHTKVLLSGGGSIIQDVTSTKSIIYYLTIMRIAVRKHLSLMVYANGIGPINKKSNRNFAKSILEKADVITLREEGSLKLLNEMEVKNKNIFVTADPALTLSPCNEELIDNVLKNHRIDANKKLIGISVRSWSKNEKNFEKVFAKNIDIICKIHNVYPLFLPMQLPYDYNFSMKICHYLKTPYYIINTKYDEKIFTGIISRCKLMIGMRLHSLIYSASVKVPIVGIVYDPKVKSFLEYINQPHLVEAKNISTSNFISVVNECLEKEKEIKQEFEKHILILEKKAFSNAQIAINLLNKENAYENTGN